MEKHLAACPKWRNRPDPRGLAIWRMTHRGTLPPCPLCGTSQHDPGCPRAEPNARWLGNGLPLSWLEAFKRVLTRRYPYGVSRSGGPAASPDDAL